MSTLAEAHLTLPGKTIAVVEVNKPWVRHRERKAGVRRAPHRSPEKLLFGAIQDPTLRIKAPIPVSVTVHDNAVVVQAENLEEFGYGDTLSDALGDLGQTLAELFHSLDKDHKRLRPELATVYDNLRAYLELRP